MDSPGAISVDRPMDAFGIDQLPKALRTRLRRRHLPPGSILFRQGDRAVAVYVVEQLAPLAFEFREINQTLLIPDMRRKPGGRRRPIKRTRIRPGLAHLLDAAFGNPEIVQAAAALLREFD